MEKLFYKDQYIKTFTANIVNVKEVNDKYHVALDKTAFFPGGGGQFCDLGEIDGEKVLEVYEENKKIYHVLDNKIEKKSVVGSIDWDRREDGMHQHFAQHVLSGCFYTKFKANTTGFHLGRDFSTVDIQGYLEEDQIREVEIFANEIIRENIPLTILTPNRDELEDIWLRRDLPNTDEDIRVVRIGELDTNACCGVHPKSTGELRLIKIKRWEKNRQSTRIEFLAGKRAVDDILRRDVYLTKICRHFKCKEEDSLKCIEKLEDKIEESIKSKKRLENIISNYEIREMIENAIKCGDILIIKKLFKNEDVKYISKIVNKITDNKNTIVLIAVENGERVNLIFSSSENLDKINMKNLLNEVLHLVEGRGGGNIHLAQGSGKNNGNLKLALESTVRKIENMI
ncbi:alanyl-tRNA editing protein AlaX-L [Romboutsia ilealis]|uniref:Alanyl-tRNA editing protein AlaX-L n=1 Tax=Romboutsia faecis TaxID=2764597 RepID=A0ABR7JKI6_9FIRM|nr:DHHA1 domain-containing protein [Romboutsia faecis]MBC5995442.1 alanyl-tRNA editing protein AlaX-L [Romboutsia faecis]MRN24315.1 alanyl-tRNA editing protein AlaX-L [Romboutsia ilealis]